MSQADPHVSLDDLLAHRDWVRALARRLVGDASRADDVEQEVWLTTLRKPPVHARSLRAWFARLVRSRTYDMHRGETRRERRENEAPPASPPPAAEEVVARVEAHRKLVIALEILKEPYRSTVLLRYYEDLPPREVASRLDIPVETVRTRLKRAREMLRRQLDEDHGGERGAWIACLAPLTGIEAATCPPGQPAAEPRPAPIGAFVATGIVVVAVVVGIALLSSGELAAPRVPEGPVGKVSEDGAGTATSGRPKSGETVAERPAGTVVSFAGLPIATGRTTVTVRDMLDGSAVPDLRFRVRIDSAEKALIANVSGRTGFPDGDVLTIVPEDDAWRVPVQHASEIRESGVIWVYRMIGVSGRVAVADDSAPLNFTSVRMSQRVAGLPGSVPPVTPRWLAAHGIRSRIRVPGPGIDGEFHVRIKAIGDVALMASARGFRDVVLRVPVDRNSDFVRGVRIVLHPAMTIRGTLRTADGRPVARHEVHLCVMAEAPRRTRTSTGENGSFELAVPADGRIILYVPRVPGHRPLYREDVIAGRSGANIDLTLTAVPDEPRVKFRYDGEALAGRTLILSFRSRGRTTAAFKITLDSAGRAPAGLFEAGRTYAVQFVSPDWRAPEIRVRWLAWTGRESEVDLSQLRLEGDK